MHTGDSVSNVWGKGEVEGVHHGGTVQSSGGDGVRKGGGLMPAEVRAA